MKAKDIDRVNECTRKWANETAREHLAFIGEAAFAERQNNDENILNPFHRPKGRRYGSL